MVARSLLGHRRRSAVPPHPKIGIIDIDNTLSTTPAGKRANEQFEKIRVKAKQAELDKKQDELKKAEPGPRQAEAPSSRTTCSSRSARSSRRSSSSSADVREARERAREGAHQADPGPPEEGEPKIEELAKTEGVNIIIDQKRDVWADTTVDLTQQLNAR